MYHPLRSFKSAPMPLLCRSSKRLLGHRNHNCSSTRWSSKTRRVAYHKSTDASDQVIFSGIQPTGVPHLGNYLGALQQWVHLQNTSPPSTRLLYSIVDLHAITVPQNPAQLKQWKRESLATLLAVGLDENRSGIFYQSSVSPC